MRRMFKTISELYAITTFWNLSRGDEKYVTLRNKQGSSCLQCDCCDGKSCRVCMLITWQTTVRHVRRTGNHRSWNERSIYLYVAWQFLIKTTASLHQPAESFGNMAAKLRNFGWLMALYSTHPYQFTWLKISYTQRMTTQGLIFNL